MAAIIIKIIFFKLKTKHTISFTIIASISHAGGVKSVIDYSGADSIESSGPFAFTEKLKKVLKENFNKDFGYGPFKKEKIKETIKLKDTYCIERWHK